MSKYVDKEFIYNLNKFIKIKGKTKTQVAKDLKISRAALNYYLAGENQPTPKTMSKMCKYFGVTRADFYKGG